MGYAKMNASNAEQMRGRGALTVAAPSAHPVPGSECTEGCSP